MTKTVQVPAHLTGWRAKDYISHVESFPKAYRHADGSYRWGTNDNVPPSDIVANWLTAGLINEQDEQTCLRVRGEMNRASLEAYAAHRAAFGAEATIVDMVTGQHLKV